MYILLNAKMVLLIHFESMMQCYFVNIPNPIILFRFFPSFFLSLRFFGSCIFVGPTQPPLSTMSSAKICRGVRVMLSHLKSTCARFIPSIPATTEKKLLEMWDATVSHFA